MIGHLGTADRCAAALTPAPRGAAHRPRRRGARPHRSSGGRCDRSRPPGHALRGGVRRGARRAGPLRRARRGAGQRSAPARSVPLLTGNRRRRRTRNVAFTETRPRRPRPAVVSSSTSTPRSMIPEPGEKRPAVIQIHGGAWVLGSKNEQGIPLLNHLASCGWVGFNVDYRLSPRGEVPEPPHRLQEGARLGPRARRGVRRRPRLRRRHRRVGRGPPVRPDGADRERPPVPARLRGCGHDGPGGGAVLRRSTTSPTATGSTTTPS